MRKLAGVVRKVSWSYSRLFWAWIRSSGFWEGGIGTRPFGLAFVLGKTCSKHVINPVWDQDHKRANQTKKMSRASHELIQRSPLCRCGLCWDKFELPGDLSVGTSQHVLWDTNYQKEGTPVRRSILNCLFLLLFAKKNT